MSNNTNILGCFISGQPVNYNDDQKTKETASNNSKLFESYIWGEKGICNSLKKLNHIDYGNDLILILFQFYVNPIPYLLSNLKEIEAYRKKEKSIGIPIIINNDNFFNKSEANRFEFLKQVILEKLDLLKDTVKSKKLDTDIDKLKLDLEQVISYTE
jgi:hypothetical protein